MNVPSILPGMRYGHIIKIHTYIHTPRLLSTRKVPNSSTYIIDVKNNHISILVKYPKELLRGFATLNPFISRVSAWYDTHGNILTLMLPVANLANTK